MTPRDAHLRPIRHVPREFERFTRPYPRSPGDPAPVGRRCPIGRPGTGWAAISDWATRHRLGGDIAPSDQDGTSHARERAEPPGWPRFHAPPGSWRSAGTIFGARRWNGRSQRSDRLAGPPRVVDQPVGDGHAGHDGRRTSPRDECGEHSRPEPRGYHNDDRHEYGDDGGDCQLLLSSGCSLLGPPRLVGILCVRWSYRTCRRTIAGRLIRRPRRYGITGTTRRPPRRYVPPTKRATTAPADAPPAPGCGGAPLARA